MADGLQAADQRLKATYTVAYIAHVPLEPRAAVAEWADGKLTVWTGTQRPFGVRDELARALGLPPEPRARDRARHRLGLRRQAHRRGGGRGGAAGEGGGQAGQAGLDARGGVHLGVLPPGRRHRGEGRGQEGRHADGLGVPQLQLGRVGPGDALRRAEPAHRVPSVPTRRCGRAPTARWRPRRTTSPASRTWTTWPTPSHMDPLAFRLQEPEGRAPAGGPRGGGQAVRLGQGEAGRRPRLRHRGRHGEGQLRGHLRRGRGGSRRAAGCGCCAW